MKNMTSSFRAKALALTSIFCAASANLHAQFITFDDTVKVVFKNVEVVNSAGETVTATEGTAIVTETDASGVITSKKQTFVQIPDGAGGDEQIVIQETITATPDPFTGNFSVEKKIKKITTPVDVASGTVTGSPTTSTTIEDISDVDENDLGLPPTTTLTAPDPELDTPVVISAE